MFTTNGVNNLNRRVEKAVMDTKILGTTEKDLSEAAAILQQGGLVAFPTETVYGLGADALNSVAVGRVYAAKGRPSDNPMIVHIAETTDIEKLTPTLTEDMKTVMNAFWPGPITIVMPKKKNVPDVTTGGLDTVAVRMPDNDIALKLIRLAGCPVAAPSANLSGRPSPTKAEHVIDDLAGRIDAVIKAGDCRVGIESTVLDLSGEAPTILRPGIITPEKIEVALGKPVGYDAMLYQRPDAGAAKPQDEGGLDAGFSNDFKPKSPGMKYKHYAPKAQMTIFQGSDLNVRNRIAKEQSELVSSGKKVGTLFFQEESWEETARVLFAELREMDKQGIDVILAGVLSTQDEVGFAVMNRMLKSAGYNVINV